MTATTASGKHVKGSFLGSIAPLPLLVDTTTDDDSVVFEDDGFEELDGPSNQFEESQVGLGESSSPPLSSSSMINHEAVSSDRDVFLSILRKKINHPKAVTPSPEHTKKKSRDSSVKQPRSRTELTKALVSPSTTKSLTLQTASSPSPLHHKKRHFKNFLLLLQPRKKTFELVEVRYESATATIGDMIRMIPHRATVADFCEQAYIGFVRPKDGMEFIKFQQNAADRIDHHEVLVAINQGCTGSQALLCSQPILANRRMVKLLGKADKHKKKQHNKGRHHSPSRGVLKPTMPMIQEQPVREETVKLSTPPPVPTGRHQLETPTLSKIQSLGVPVEHGSTAASLLTRVVVSPDDTSVSSGSSLSRASSTRSQTTEYHVVTRTKRNRRRKRAKRQAVAIKCGAGALLCSVITYLMDSSAATNAAVRDATMGMAGLGQTLVLLFALVMMQNHLQNRQGKRSHSDARRHMGFPRLTM